MLASCIGDFEPAAAQMLEPLANRRGQRFLPSAMEAELEGESPSRRQRHVIARKPDFLEAVMTLEVHQRSTAPVVIDQIRQVPSLAELYGFGDQGVVGGFIPVCELRDDLPEESISSRVSHHG